MDGSEHTWIAEALARRALDAAAAPDRAAVWSRTLCNLAAALGRKTVPSVRRVMDDEGPGSAAFVAATLFHARTQDDFYPLGRAHIGAVVLPATLAVGTQDLIPALAAGYEVLTVVSEAYADRAQQRGLRPSGIFGPIGAAAAAGVALGFDADVLASALAVASVLGAGTNQSWLDGTDEWLLEMGAAARAGVDAVRLVGGGFAGSRRAFEGAAGWSAAYFNDEGGSLLRTTLQDPHARTQEVAIKPFPVSGIAQVPTALAAEVGEVFDRRLPASIQVRMSSKELEYPGSRNRGPFHGRSDSLMSVARCVALGYLRGIVPVDVMARPPLADEGVLIERVELVAEPELNETEVVVSAIIDGERVVREGRGADLLYPTWEELKGSLAHLAQRSEAPTEGVERAAELLEAGASTDAYIDLLDLDLSQEG